MITASKFICPDGLIRKALNNQLTDQRVSLNEPTGDFFYDPWIIKEEYKNTVWEQILNSLDTPVGEARIIKLDSGKSYYAHADIDDRWHLNLSGEYSYLIDLDNNKMFELVNDNIWYCMNAGLLHSASNFGSVTRNQLVVRKLLEHSTDPNMISITIKPAVDKFDIRYQFDKMISPWLNQQNKKKNIDNFKNVGNTVTLKIASNLKDELLKLADGLFIVEEHESCL
jgi:hypothetical protein